MLLGVVLLLFGASHSPDPEGFRGADWGSSLDETLALEADKGVILEKAPVPETDLAMFVATEFVEVGGISARLLYFFRQGRLVAGQYGTAWIEIARGPTESYEFFTKFENLSRRLEQKYGPPADTGEEWLGRKGTAGIDGAAILDRRLALEPRWEFPTTVIHLRLHGYTLEGKGGAMLTVDYEDRKFFEAKAEERKKKELEGL